MTRSWQRFGIVGAAALAAAAALAVRAQDEGATEPEPLVAGTGEAEAPAAEVKPRPAEMMPLTPRSLLLDVFHNGQQYVAVGDRGGIILSADGAEWTQVPVPVRAALCAVYFTDPQNGWAVGHDATIVATKDGGRSWALQHFEPAMEKPLLDVLFLDASRGYAVGAYGLVLQTENGGQTWTELDAPAIREEEVHFNSIIRLGNGDLFIAGESGMLGVSRDEGRTWQRLESPYDSSLFGALPAGDKGALIFGLRGNAYITQDVRADKWTKVETGTVASMFGGTRLPEGGFAMVGLNGVILVADSSGGSVRAVQADSGTPLASAIPMNGTLLAVGESGVQPVALQ
jgi:photosystem II stability/assembly factor-like uncharacterized protein